MKYFFMDRCHSTTTTTSNMLFKSYCRIQNFKNFIEFSVASFEENSYPYSVIVRSGAVTNNNNSRRKEEILYYGTTTRKYSSKNIEIDRKNWRGMVCVYPTYVYYTTYRSLASVGIFFLAHHPRRIWKSGIHVASVPRSTNSSKDR